MSKEQYDKIADEYSRMRNSTKEYVLIPTFKKIIGKVQNKSVLDLACGEGFFTRILAEMNPSELIGLDFSKELIKKAKDHNSNITYLVEDVLTLNLNKQFDLITAVYLLNYAKTKDELAIMCQNIYTHLNETGNFSTITTSPSLKPMKDFEYERKFSSVAGKKLFEDGDEVRMEIMQDGEKLLEVINYYWTKETYEDCLKKAGFKKIQWVKAIISEEGTNLYGTEFWDKFQKNHSTIGIVCEK
ncbi:class I SAM-dependent methyltransferase [Candidatus Woesearchaeota archaeon]|mgnify:CR=1 FL=1|jgi:toxoflavin synthase|nr:class I SAM-dependent methyltransferase [Candidatus Woesearchaeota archaeon]MBT3304820.1 class I SAM-dependent methyltransferase [Candidatus Woesearchaeota archaeon]MBT4367844.1 class I SAM-dependent methyltransferase [Candidatus Woesearchaeota archaeon]MBT4712332.1 class I SAM-dependent methyltransferase [Candidatus Woesearchaeota archaeon]MBT6639244.1 class I SAM-dependent methyltransferase [Candidatus Woesearchaeota archaeon]